MVNFCRILRRFTRVWAFLCETMVLPSRMSNVSTTSKLSENFKKRQYVSESERKKKKKS